MVREVHQDLPVRARGPRRLGCLVGNLHPPLGVRVGPGLLRERGSGENDVRVAGGLGEEEVLDREEFQVLEPRLRVRDIRVGDDRVLTHDEQGADRRSFLRHLGDLETRL